MNPLPLKDEMMAESPDELPQPKAAPAEASAEAAPPGATAEPPAPADPTAADSATFSRCAACTNAEGVNSAAGTLVCKKHNMLINAEADEIPDDCVEYEPKDGEAGAERGAGSAE